MRILITNDDGVNSEGIKILAEAASKIGEVIVVAPLTEQSAKSHAITIKNGMQYFEVDDIVSGVKTYAVDATPADCVRFAKYFLKDNYDIVFSGINNGFNLGEDILYSGTVGAATEGVLTGAKAIAFSTKHKNFEYAKLYIDKVIAYIFENNFLDKTNLLNVNIPLEPKGIKLTKQGNTNFDTYFTLEEGLVWQKGKPDFSLDQKIDSDVKAVHEGYISICPLTTDRTDFDFFR